MLLAILSCISKSIFSRNPAALVLIGAILMTRVSSADPLSNAAVFARCYASLTRTVLPKDHHLLASVKSGVLTPADACMQVLQTANLTLSGIDKGYLSGRASAQAEGLNVIRTFHDFHRTWFPADNFTLFPIYEWVQQSAAVYDVAEPALHLTRAVLQKGVNYKDIVTTDPVLEAYRSNGTAAAAGGMQFTQVLPGQITGSISVPGFASGQLPGVQTGQLIGVGLMTDNSVKNSISLSGQINTGGGTSPYVTQAINQSFGGGLLGSPSFLMLNNGRPDNTTPDGGLRLSRRWSQAVFNDLLCRSLPVLRASDASLYIETKTTSATPPFRSGNSCMRCHAGMDPMATAIRNINTATSSNFGTNGVAMVVINAVASLPSESGFVDSDPQFYLRLPKGRLVYRSYDGSFVNIPVNGISELGSAIASTNDFYVCAAKRYFQFFTGINVNLQDIGDSSNSQLSDDDITYRNRVIELGLQLKKDQSLPNLIHSIFASPLYQSSTFRSSSH